MSSLFRRICGLALATAALALVGCDTDPATDVGYSVATLHGTRGCELTESGEWFFEYRAVGASAWTPGPAHAYACFGSRDGPDVQERIFGLRDDTDYEYRLTLQGPDWGPAHFDRTGTLDGTAYERFRTRQGALAGAQPGRSLGDSLGVNIRHAYEFTSWDNQQALRGALAYTGLRHAHDGIWWRREDLTEARLVPLAQVGITFTLSPFVNRLAERFFVEDGVTKDRLRENLDQLKAHPALLAATKGLESLNEPDCFDPAAIGLPLLDYQSDLFAMVNADPALRGIAVVGPSFCSREGIDATGNLGPWMDVGNFHPYPSGQAPLTDWAERMDECEHVSGGKPCEATEVGYQIDTVNTAPPCWYQPEPDPCVWHRPVSQEVRAIYTLQMALDNFRVNVPRTDFYTLVAQACEPPEDAGEPTTNDFGFYDCNWNPTAVAHAMHNFTRILDTNGPAVSPEIIRLGIDGDDAPDELRYLVFTSADGAYRIALWRDVSIWNRETLTPITVTPDRVEVAFSGPYSRVDVYSPADSDSPIATTTGPRVSVDVAGKPMILKLTP